MNKTIEVVSKYNFETTEYGPIIAFKLNYEQSVTNYKEQSYYFLPKKEVRLNDDKFYLKLINRTIPVLFVFNEKYFKDYEDNKIGPKLYEQAKNPIQILEEGKYESFVYNRLGQNGFLYTLDNQPIYRSFVIYLNFNQSNGRDQAAEYLSTCVSIKNVEVDNYCDDEGDYNLSFLHYPDSYDHFMEIYNEFSSNYSEKTLRKAVLSQLGVLEFFINLGGNNI